MGNDNVKDYPPYLDYPKPRKPMTNADRIRSMTDEELAALFKDHFCPMLIGADMDCQNSCEKCWLDWLKQEARDDEP